MRGNKKLANGPLADLGGSNDAPQVLSRLSVGANFKLRLKNLLRWLEKLRFGGLSQPGNRRRFLLIKCGVRIINPLWLNFFGEH